MMAFDYGFDVGNIILGRPRTPKGARLAPSPTGAAPLLGHIRWMRRDPISFFLRAQRECGDIARFRFGPITAHLVSHPRFAKHVLQDQHRRYTKRTPGFETIRLVLGNGLLTSEGSFWLRQRRIAQPAFHRRRIETFGELMVRAADDTIDRWDRMAGRDEIINVLPEMMRLTLKVVAEALFGADVSRDTRIVGEALDFIVAYLNRRIHSVVAPPLEWPILGNRRFLQHLERLDGIVGRMIEQRRQSGEPREDLLGLLMEARDEETGERMTDAQLRDEVMTLFLAGHETTANTLTWTFYLLAKHPEVRANLHREVDALSSAEVGVSSLSRLGYTRQVIQESLRLYPPAWTLGRSPGEDDEIGGYHVPAGSIVFISPYVIHRHPEIWRDPTRFDPERFEEERLAELPRLAYLPFGGGPRLCIGNNFALLEAQLVLARLAQRYDLVLAEGREPEPASLITLRPRDGVWLRLQRR